MPRPEPDYRGRFAPSPTGPLHLGSLIAALASFLDARHRGGNWLLRMEDLDPPREEAGAAQRILNSLQQHGLAWDGDVMWQSDRGNAYDSALQRLADDGHLFHCDCTRAILGPGGACRGRCAGRQQQINGPRSLRVQVPAHCLIEFNDRGQGAQRSSLGEELPDFVLRRKDGLYAYQLAVVVDDAEQDVTDIVRGSDLLDSTPRQIFLQQLLGYPTPDYRHLPVITSGAGQKFSKQNHAPALDDAQAPKNLRLALRFLRQGEPPTRLVTVQQVLAHAVQYWSPDAIPQRMNIDAASIGLRD